MMNNTLQNYEVSIQKTFGWLQRQEKICKFVINLIAIFQKGIQKIYNIISARKIIIRSQKMLLFCMFTTILIRHILAHEKIIVDGGSKQISGLINRMIPIDVRPFANMIHSASTIISEDSQYIVVQPATVYPLPQKWPTQNYLMLPTNAVNLLDELRTYQSSHYKDITVFQQYIFLHLLPNKIIIVRQNQQLHLKIFTLENTYELQGLTIHNQTKMYKIQNKEQIKVLLVISNSKVIYELGLTQTKKFILPQINLISHLQFISDNVFVAAENGLGIRIYQIKKDQIKLLQSYGCQNLQLALHHRNKTEQFQKSEDIIAPQQQKPTNTNNNQCKISDIFYNKSSQTLYILDYKTGIHSTVVRLNNIGQNDKNILQKIDIVMQTKDCDSFDLVSSQYFVLMCMIGMPNSYIQQIIKLPDPLLQGQYILVKKDPIYINCNLKDLVVNDDFFLIFDSYSIDIFWNSMKSGSLHQLSTEHSKQHFNIPGFQVFALRKPKDNVIYIVDSNILYKYKLNVFNGSISAYSPIPVNKQIKIQIPGKCNSTNYAVLTANREINKNFQCFYQVKVLLNIVQKLQSVSQQKISMSLGAIILMIAVMLILTWICLVKYKGLQKHARKILQRQREKNRYNHNKFTI